MREDDIRRYLARHLELLERGLTLLKEEFPLANPAGAGGRIDILARDSFGQFVLIEIKRSDKAARWESMVPLLLDEIETSNAPAVTCSFYNPANLIAGLQSIASNCDLSKFPEFQILVEDHDGEVCRILHGVCTWTGKLISISPEQMFMKAFGGIQAWMMHQHFHQTWEYESAAFKLHHLKPMVVEWPKPKSSPVLVVRKGGTLKRADFRMEDHLPLSDFADANLAYLSALSDLVGGGTTTCLRSRMRTSTT